MRKVGDLSALHEKYYAKGFRVVAFSSESASLLESKMLSSSGAKYWIGSDPEQETMRHFVQGGTIGIPKFYLVDSKGRVVAEEVPSEARIEELLAEIFDVPLGRELHLKLEKARVAYDARCYGAAWKRAGALLEEDDEKLVADAVFLREKVESYAAYGKATLLEARDQQSSAVTYGELMQLERRFAGTEAASWAAAQRKELAKTEPIKDERGAWSAYEKALKRELAAEGVEWKLKAVRGAYEKVAGKYGRSQPGTLAREAVNALPAS